MKRTSIILGTLALMFSQNAYACHDQLDADKERKFVQAVRDGKISARKAAEQFPYLEFVHQGAPQKHPQEGIYHNQTYKITMIERYDKYRQDSLEWRLGGFKFQQYYDPKDFRVTLAVTNMKTKETYYSQQRFETGDADSDLVDVYFDSKNQIEYWYDDVEGTWVVEHPDTFKHKTYNHRNMALRQVKKWGVEDKDPFHIFSTPAVLRAQKELEDREYYADRPSLWKAAFLGYLALSGDPADRLRDKVADWIEPAEYGPSGTVISASTFGIVDRFTSWFAPFAILTMSSALTGQNPSSPKGVVQKAMISGGLSILGGEGVSAWWFEDTFKSDHSSCCKEDPDDCFYKGHGILSDKEKTKSEKLKGIGCLKESIKVSDRDPAQARFLLYKNRFVYDPIESKSFGHLLKAERGGHKEAKEELNIYKCAVLSPHFDDPYSYSAYLYDRGKSLVIYADRLVTISRYACGAGCFFYPKTCKVCDFIKKANYGTTATNAIVHVADGVYKFSKEEYKEAIESILYAFSVAQEYKEFDTVAKGMSKAFDASKLITKEFLREIKKPENFMKVFSSLIVGHFAES